MLRFISFGSGSSGNCYYLFTETDGLMIDVGLGLRGLKKWFADYGLSLSSVRNIIVTHDHADHVKSVGSMSYKYNLPVYATAMVHEGIERNYVVHHKIDKSLKRFVRKGVTTQVGEFGVTPFDVPHDSVDHVGYCIEHGGVTFCLITDVGMVTDVVASYIARADYLVMEANHDVRMLLAGKYPEFLKRRIMGGRGHLSNDACAAAVAANMSPRLRMVWLCHLSQENNLPELAQTTVEDALNRRGAAATKVFVLKRRSPSQIFCLQPQNPSPVLADELG